MSSNDSQDQHHEARSEGHPMMEHSNTLHGLYFQLQHQTVPDQGYDDAATFAHLSDDTFRLAIESLDPYVGGSGSYPEILDGPGFIDTEMQSFSPLPGSAASFLERGIGVNMTLANDTSDFEPATKSDTINPGPDDSEESRLFEDHIRTNLFLSDNNTNTQPVESHTSPPPLGPQSEAGLGDRSRIDRSGNNTCTAKYGSDKGPPPPPQNTAKRVSKPKRGKHRAIMFKSDAEMFEHLCRSYSRFD
ncbi:uncharacterized protein I303_107754 [Kwoniella dejecticola CBS 10117]|uniref:Uncharacterized protein n=1 Tax=Kwoniella dejecticola CBS 10117 TaxID=1296121 RepID=A0A1A5ZVM1_9TREE|nr:uncharacterized protein I303_07759 [Kwoniella dejecticola CBS 10117]OBR81849.1 hypothetical protein I303_07759 [Kwoniella dejecticola CBS 10117]